MLTPNYELRQIARWYNESILLPAPVEGHYVEVDHDFARSIALAYEKLPARDDAALPYYSALAREVRNQFRFLLASGYEFHPWQKEGQPYANSREMCCQVAEEKRLYFFTGGEVHPFLGRYSGWTIDGVELTCNDIFRAVHDIFGHAAEGYQFGQRGEENAWIHHSMMFSRMAQLALTSETRGQNSWVNESDQNAGKPACDRDYAEQKAALLPDEFTFIPLSIAAMWR